MKEWSRIDLHQHTNHDIDCYNRNIEHNYSHKNYYLWLKEQNVKLKAVTNHNNIDLSEHIKHALIADLLNINSLVGVEIDYKFSKNRFHAITILNPATDIILFIKKYEKIKKTALEENNSLCLDQSGFSELHSNLEFIFIPHAIKDKGILEAKKENLEFETVNWITESLLNGMGMPIILENTKSYHSLSLASKIEYKLGEKNINIPLPAYVGSDYKFDNNQERVIAISKKPKYSIQALPTYRGLELSVRNYKTRLSLDSDIIDRINYVEKIVIEESPTFEKTTLDLSHGLNVIIGESGTGKTMLLNEIFRQLTGEPLKAALIGDNVKNNKPYSDIIDKTKISVQLSDGTENKDVNIIEIPNLYSEILKAQEDDDTVRDMFGLSKVSQADKIIRDYKKNLRNFAKVIEKKDEYTQLAEDNLRNILTAIDFINSNPITYGRFDLKQEIYRDENKIINSQKIKDIENLITESKMVKKHFEHIRKYLIEEEDLNRLDSILINYSELLKVLTRNILQLKELDQKMRLEEMLHNKINKDIGSTIKLLGAREKTYLQREQTMHAERESFTKTIKNILKIEFIATKTDLSFNYIELKTAFEKQRNDYARITLNDDIYSIKNVDLLDSPLIETKNNITKIKNSGVPNINFQDDQSVKNAVIKLLKYELDLSNLIMDANLLPTNIEIYSKESNAWRLASKMNKGDIAKRSIEFYFNDLIIKKQPDIIVMDQPENDVDKKFLTDTLSQFLIDQKSNKQVIVTSHDAIVTINSDVNKIVKSEINEKSKFVYESFELERVDYHKLTGTNIVSEILDGGKINVKKRYQIYGGELTNED